MATLYCGPSGTGAQDGSDFNNLMTLPNSTSFIRGNIYKVIKGNYGAKTLSTATSGTTTIRIEFVTSEDSAVLGYSSTLHDAPAVFSSFNPRSQYWIVNGKVRTETEEWSAPSGYGFRCTGGIQCSSLDGDDADNCEFHYIDIGATYEVNPNAATILTYSTGLIQMIYNQTNVKFSHCAIHNGRGTLVQGAGSDDLIFEYCHFGPGWGKEAIRGGNQNLSTGWIIRHNRFWNSANKDPNDETGGITAEIAIWASDSGSFDNFEIHGNWFFNQYDVDGRNAVIVIGGDGVNWVGVGGTNNKVYNNTFEGIADGSGFSDIVLNGTGNEAKNNLFYNCTTSSVSASTATNNVTASTDPFIDSANHDYRLAEAVAGTSLASDFNTDYYGNTRGSDGVWDVGASEFDSGGSSPSPSAICKLRTINKIANIRKIILLN